jgi:exopolyphosphatase/guanosine-5'-triphosphate,3'-diphosphate pyrophosphatase
VRVAVIDCGTNTIRLLIAEQSPTGLKALCRDLAYVRLGQGVDATHRFDDAALARTLSAVDEYAEMIRDTEVDRVRFIATSAARDATNRDEFFAGVRARIGLDPDIISGTEEARLGFLGAVAGGPVGPGRILVSDIGGGSTELALGDATGAIERARSFDIGSVRLRERFLVDDPPTGTQIEAARAYVADLLDHSGMLAPDSIDHFIGVAGTSTSLSAMVTRLAVYDPLVVHNSVVEVSDILALSARLFRHSVAATLRQYPILEPLRAEVISAGVLIAAEIARRVARPMVVRETDILDGAALDLMRAASS